MHVRRAIPLAAGFVSALGALTAIVALRAMAVLGPDGATLFIGLLGACVCFLAGLMTWKHLDGRPMAPIPRAPETRAALEQAHAEYMERLRAVQPSAKRLQALCARLEAELRDSFGWRVLDAPSPAGAILRTIHALGLYGNGGYALLVERKIDLDRVAQDFAAMDLIELSDIFGNRRLLAKWPTLRQVRHLELDYHDRALRFAESHGLIPFDGR